MSARERYESWIRFSGGDASRVTDLLRNLKAVRGFLDPRPREA